MQKNIEANVEKRSGKIYGAPAGKKLVVFIDDMNMPKREEYGAQPPIELLRQWMDHQGWYDRKIRRFKYTVDVGFVGAMGPPGGGRNDITARIIRHFNIISYTDIEDSTISKIFTTISLRCSQKSNNFAKVSDFLKNLGFV